MWNMFARRNSAKPSDALKIFVSYSRRDIAVADTMVEDLTARGFEVKIDLNDLPFGEKWQHELSEMIADADTVIWLISAHSISSHWCNWELDEVARNNKRLVPVQIGEILRDQLPRQLGEIHILPQAGIYDPKRHLDNLVVTLEADRVWLKTHARLADRAREWLGKERTSALLLRGSALRESEAWKDGQPAKAPRPHPQVLDLLLSSRRSAMRRQGIWAGGAVTAACVFGVLFLGILEFYRRSQVAYNGASSVTAQIIDMITQELREREGVDRRLTVALLDRSNATLESLLVLDPENQAVLMATATAHTALGDTYARMAQYEKSLAHARQAATSAERLLADLPKVPQVQRLAAGARIAEANALGRLGDEAGAKRALERARTLGTPAAGSADETGQVASTGVLAGPFVDLRLLREEMSATIRPEAKAQLADRMLPLADALRTRAASRDERLLLAEIYRVIADECGVRQTYQVALGHLQTARELIQPILPLAETSGDLIVARVDFAIRKSYVQILSDSGANDRALPELDRLIADGRRISGYAGTEDEQFALPVALTLAFFVHQRAKQADLAAQRGVEAARALKGLEGTLGRRLAFRMMAAPVYNKVALAVMASNAPLGREVLGFDIAFHREILQRNPTDVPAQSALAHALYGLSAITANRDDNIALLSEAADLWRKLERHAEFGKVASSSRRNAEAFLRIHTGWKSADSLFAQKRHSDAYASAVDAATATEQTDVQFQGKPTVAAAEAWSRVAGHALFAGFHEKARELSQRALMIHPEQPHYETRLAAAHMFLGEREDALKYYRKNRGKTIPQRRNVTWEAAVGQAFEQFRKEGMSHPLMQEVEAILVE